MSKSERVVVRLRSGAEYGLPDAATARRIYPGGQIIRYQDGRPYTDGDEAPDAALDLDKASRAELDAYAATVGIDPADYSRKGDLLKAIREADA